MRYGRDDGAGVEHPVFNRRTRRAGIDEYYRGVRYNSVSREQINFDEEDILISLLWEPVWLWFHA